MLCEVTDLALRGVFGVNGVRLRGDSYGMRWALPMLSFDSLQSLW